MVAFLIAITNAGVAFDFTSSVTSTAAGSCHGSVSLHSQEDR